MKKKLSIFIIISIFISNLLYIPLVEARMKGDVIFDFKDTETIKFINKDIFNLEYIEYKNDGIYKFVEKMSQNFSDLKTKIYKFNESTSKYEFQKEIISVVHNGEITQKEKINGTTITKVYNLPRVNILNFKEGRFLEFGVNSSEKWYTEVKEGSTFLGNASISSIIQALGSAVGAAIGAAIGGIGGAAGGAFIGGYIGGIAQKIYERNVKSVKFISTIKWRYDYPYYYYNTRTEFYDEDDKYNEVLLGVDEVEGKLGIHM